MNTHRYRRGPALALAALLALGMLAVAACNGDEDEVEDGGNGAAPAATVGDLSIYEPWARYTMGANAAAYFRVSNAGAEDRLVEAQTDVARMVELHEVVTENGTGRMQEVEGGIVVPAEGEVELRPGGYHVMLMGLERQLEDGEELSIMLVFETAGEVTISARVEAITGDNGEGSGNMNGGHGHGMGGGGMASASAEGDVGPDATIGDLTISEPWTRYTMGANAAAYFHVSNAGAEDRIVEARTDVARMVELHEVVSEGATSRMQELEGGMVIPAHGELELRPGGYHVMLMGLERELEDGEELSITLVFEHSGELTIVAPVRTVSQPGHGRGHGQGMGGGGMPGASSEGAVGPDATIGDLTVSEPWTRYAMGPGRAVAFFHVRNAGAEDRLVEVRTDVARMVELQEVATEDATSRMQEVKGGMVIPAHGELELRPGGHRVMLMGLERELEEGEELSITLVFENAGELTIVAPVQTVSQGQGQGQGHGQGQCQGHDQGQCQGHRHGQQDTGAE